ncbi:MAG: aldehyde dehydrogenase family protein [Planctomycetia bacterium]
MSASRPTASAAAPEIQPVLIDGAWCTATSAETFRAFDPTTGAARETPWPVSAWADVDRALDAAARAAVELRRLPSAAGAAFLERYAERLAGIADELAGLAHAETGLAMRPRLLEVELPRMLDQLRQAAAAAREGSWRMAMIDTQRNIRSCAVGLGPVVVFPPANFPLAFGAVTGGDFAAAIAAGNPVIAKAHPGCPAVSARAAREAVAAVRETGLPAAAVQLLHGIAPADGDRLVADPRIGASGFTGGQEAGKRLFAAASAAGRVIWVEMGSINPVVLLPGAIAERPGDLAGELTASVTGSAGQFCTKPGVVLLVDDEAAGAFVAAVRERFAAIGPQVLLGPTGRRRLVDAIGRLQEAGAEVLVGSAGTTEPGPCTHVPTLLEVSGSEALNDPERLIVEAFGNATLLIRCRSIEEIGMLIGRIEGALAASLYRATDGRDDAAVAALAPLVVERAGRVIENRMPTGLAVTPPMQHGGPWPSASPPFFSAVGFPWSILRFARRVCFDGFGQGRLPDILRDSTPQERPWRFVDGGWTRG